MFRIHETTLRQTCRAAFILLVLAPTVAVASWAALRRLPSHRAEYEARLRQCLGLNVKIARVSHPRPGVVLLGDVSLADVETGRPLFACRALEAASVESSLVVRLSAAELDILAAEHVWRLAERRLRGQLVGADKPIRVVVDGLTWRGADFAQTFTDVAVQVRSSPAGNEAALSFRVAGADMPESATLRIVRRAGAAPTTAVTLATGSARLPARVFAPFSAAAESLGSGATFHGCVWAEETPAGWAAELTGQLGGVDLDCLVSAKLPHALSGTCEVQLQRARFCEGRLTEAAGSIAASGGTISRSLLEAGRQSMALGGPAVYAENDTMIRYDRLALDFIFEGYGLKLIGRCPTQQRGTLLSGSGRALWVQPALQPQPVVNLVRMLAPANEAQVPAGDLAQQLLRHLPVAPIVSPAPPAGQLPQALMRLRQMK